MKGLLYYGTEHGAFAAEQAAFVHTGLVRAVYCRLIVINDYRALRQPGFLSRMQLTARIAKALLSGSFC